MTYRRRLALVAIGLLAAASVIGAPVFGQLELGGSHDANLPIEITADSLEVQQEQQLAIFRGTVDAVQGEMNLRADVLVVHYRPREDNQNSISLIEAEGSVFVSSPTEMAQGDRGTYDVDAQVVTLDGAVVLTQGEKRHPRRPYGVEFGDRSEQDVECGIDGRCQGTR